MANEDYAAMSLRTARLEEQVAVLEQRLYLLVRRQQTAWAEFAEDGQRS